MSSSNHSKHHPDRPCSSCTLCGKKDSKYYSHYATGGQKEREFLMRYCENEPTPSSCICLAHYKEAQQKRPASFVPKWKRTATCTSKYYKCIYPNCSTLPSNRLISLICHSQWARSILKCKKQWRTAIITVQWPLPECVQSIQLTNYLCMLWDSSYSTQVWQELPQTLSRCRLSTQSCVERRELLRVMWFACLAINAI